MYLNMVHADMSEPEDKSGVTGEGSNGHHQTNSIHVRNNDVYFRVSLPSNKDWPNNAYDTSDSETKNPSACFILPPQVAFIGEDIERIPEDLIQRHGQTAKRLDLSFNRLRYWLSILLSI